MEISFDLITRFCLIKQLETALIYDGVQLLAKALHELDRNQDISLKRLTCDGFDSWNYGPSVVKYMKMVIIQKGNASIPDLVDWPRAIYSEYASRLIAFHYSV